MNLGLCCRANDENSFEADFGAFDFPIRNLTLPSSIGNGLHFVSKLLTSRFSGKLTKTQPIVDYLVSLNHQGESLMISDTLSSAAKLQLALMVVYILDQVRALEAELLLRIKQQGLNVKPQILVMLKEPSAIRSWNQSLIPNIPTFYVFLFTHKGILRQWVSRFDIYPYLERFTKPALYEAFGLTVIEAMSCGFPTFATNQGGPAEIIVDGISGFHIDPHNGEESSNKIADFFEKCLQDSTHWNKISAAGLQRINECNFQSNSLFMTLCCNYTWKIYANKMLNMGSIYTFWRWVNNEQKEAKQRYIKMFYNLMYKNLVKTIPVPNHEPQ
ncbi:hypothetical protein JHK86_049208 [Glycine max]|nr:hypothetical protein JHK86_049208 [Glycine max]